MSHKNSVKGFFNKTRRTQRGGDPNIKVNIKYSFAHTGPTQINVDEATIPKDNVFAKTTELNTRKETLNKFYTTILTSCKFNSFDVSKFIFYIKQPTDINYKLLQANECVIIDGGINYENELAIHVVSELYAKISEIKADSIIYITHNERNTCLPKMSLRAHALTDYNNPFVFKLLNTFSNRFESMRKIRGDGNCYFASVIFGLLENIIGDKTDRIDKMNVFNKIIELPDSNVNIAKLLSSTNYESYLRVANNDFPWPQHYDKKIFDKNKKKLIVKIDASIYEWSKSTQTKNVETHWLNAEDFETDYMSSDWLYITLITICKILVSLWMITNFEAVFDGLSINYIIEGLPTDKDGNVIPLTHDAMVNVCVNRIMRWELSAEGIFIQKGALSNMLKCDIINVNSPRTKPPDKPFDDIRNIYIETDKIGSVTTAFRPGHYDLLYERKESPSPSPSLIKFDIVSIKTQIQTYVSYVDANAVINFKKMLDKKNNTALNDEIDEYVKTLIDINKPTQTYIAFCYFNKRDPEDGEIASFIGKNTSTESLLLQTLDSYNSNFNFKLCDGLTISLPNDTTNTAVLTTHFVFKVPKVIKDTTATATTTNPNTVTKIKTAVDEYLLSETTINFFKTKTWDWSKSILEARIEIMQHTSNAISDINLFFQGWLFSDNRDNKSTYPLIGVFDHTACFNVQNASIGENGFLNISKTGTEFFPQSYSQTGEIGNAKSAVVKFKQTNKICDFFAVCVDLQEQIPRILLVYVVVLPTTLVPTTTTTLVPTTITNTFAELVTHKFIDTTKQQKVEQTFLEFFNNTEKSAPAPVPKPVPKPLIRSDALKITTNASNVNFNFIMKNLTNAGKNSCYYNSIIQCLIHLPAFYELLTKYIVAVTTPAQSISAYSIISDLFGKIKSGKQPIYILPELKKINKSQFTQLIDNGTEDAFEFYRLLIDSFDVELCTAANASCTEFKSIFYGNYKHHRISTISITYFNDLYILLDVNCVGFGVKSIDGNQITNGVVVNNDAQGCDIISTEGAYTQVKYNLIQFNDAPSVNGFLKTHFTEETLESNERRQWFIKTPPKILVIQLKIYDATHNKNMMKIKLDEQINVKEYMVDDKTKDVMYNLVGISVHSGSTINGGHYVSYCKNASDNTWYYFNDIPGDNNATKVEKNINEEIQGQPYVLFYERQETNVANVGTGPVSSTKAIPVLNSGPSSSINSGTGPGAIPGANPGAITLTNLGSNLGATTVSTTGATTGAITGAIPVSSPPGVNQCPIIITFGPNNSISTCEIITDANQCTDNNIKQFTDSSPKTDKSQYITWVTIVSNEKFVSNVDLFNDYKSNCNSATKISDIIPQ